MPMINWFIFAQQKKYNTANAKSYYFGKQLKKELWKV